MYTYLNLRTTVSWINNEEMNIIICDTIRQYYSIVTSDSCWSVSILWPTFSIQRVKSERYDFLLHLMNSSNTNKGKIYTLNLSYFQII